MSRDDLITGIPQIDDQHAVILTVFENLKKVGQSNTYVDSLRMLALIHDLEHYATVHFVLEETLMDFFEYRDREDHKAEHAYFREAVHVLDRRRNNHDAINDSIGYLERWITNHIGATDQRMAKQLLKCKKCTVRIAEVPA